MNVFVSQMQIKHKLILFVGIVSAIAVAVSVAMMGGMVGATPGGPNCTVAATGADYPTIQAAVDNAGCQTVKVAAGTYNESVNVNRTVKIKGAKAGQEVKNRTFGAANESIVDGNTPGQPAFMISAANVVIDGFSITNPNETIGVTVKTAGNNARIRNNIVDGVGSPSYNQAATVGIYLEYGPDNVNVSGNRISNVKAGGTWSAQGVLVGDSTSPDPSLNIELDGNTITDIASLAKGAYGIQVNNGAKTPFENIAAVGYAEVKIRANSIKGLTGNWAHGIGLEGETPNAVVRYNTISNITDSNPNPISDAIAVNFESNQFFFTTTVNRNNLNVGPLAAGIAVNPSLTTLYPSLSVDGECNYWGANNGPLGVLGATATGNGSLVTPGVDYSPWLKSSNLNGKCGDKWNKDKDDDNHHGDYNCDYDDRREWKYND